MNIENAANKLSELGHVARLRIYRHLVKAGSDGMSVSNLQALLEIPNSTLSHHIHKLVQVGLVKQVREGRVLKCIAQFDQLDELLSFLIKECCQSKC